MVDLCLSLSLFSPNSISHSNQPVASDGAHQAEVSAC